MLRDGAWFRGLPERLQATILDRSIARTHAKGEIVAVQGLRPEGLYAIVEGKLAWRRLTGAGADMLLYIGGPGAWFGHLGLVRDAPMQFQVVAHTAARTLLLPRAEYRRLVEKDPANYRRIADQALERLELLIRLYAESRTLPAEELIPAWIATLAELQKAESGRPGNAVELMLTQSELAAMIGVSRQTLNAALKRLEAEALIDVGFGHLRIPDPARLPRAGSGASRRAPSIARRATRGR